jgi:hypothetical protein
MLILSLFIVPSFLIQLLTLGQQYYFPHLLSKRQQYENQYENGGSIFSHTGTAARRPFILTQAMVCMRLAGFIP